MPAKRKDPEEAKASEWTPKKTKAEFTPKKATPKAATPKASAAKAADKAATPKKKATPSKPKTATPKEKTKTAAAEVVLKEASVNDTPSEMVDPYGEPAPLTGINYVIMMPVKFALFFGARKFRVHRVGGECEPGEVKPFCLSMAWVFLKVRK